MNLVILMFFIIGSVLLYLSIGMDHEKFNRNMTKIKNRQIQLKHRYNSDEINYTMKNAGIPFSLYHYQMARWTLLVFFVSSLVINYVIIMKFNPLALLLVLVFYVVSLPKTMILQYRSPFQLMIDGAMASRRQRYNEELYLAVSQMKNSFLIKKDRPPSSQYVLEEVSRYTDKTRHIFNRFMGYWQTGEIDHAVEYFEKSIGTKEAKNLCQVFIKLDELNPVEMKLQLDTYQDIYRSERETAKKKKNEHKSNLLFMMIIGTCLMLTVNFLAIAFFIDFLKNLNELF